MPAGKFVIPTELNREVIRPSTDITEPSGSVSTGSIISMPAFPEVESSLKSKAKSKGKKKRKRKMMKRRG